MKISPTVKPRKKVLPQVEIKLTYNTLRETSIPLNKQYAETNPKPTPSHQGGGSGNGWNSTKSANSGSNKCWNSTNQVHKVINLTALLEENESNFQDSEDSIIAKKEEKQANVQK